LRRRKPPLRYRGIACALIAAALVLATTIAPAAAQRAEPGTSRPGIAGVPATAAIGRITLSPARDQPFSPTVPWLAHRPDGTLVDCAGTQTSCFQEAENEAFAKGWSLDVYGPGGAVVSGINATRGIVLHPLRQRYVALHGTIISCAPIDEPCLTVDSMVEGALILNDGAQITSTPKTASVPLRSCFNRRPSSIPKGFRPSPQAASSSATRRTASRRACRPRPSGSTPAPATSSATSSLPMRSTAPDPG
jgi:hypothetical protein